MIDDVEDERSDADGPPPSTPWWPTSRLGRVLVGLLLVASIALLVPFARRGDWLAVFVIPGGAAIGVLVGRYVKKRDPYG